MIKKHLLLLLLIIPPVLIYAHEGMPPDEPVLDIEPALTGQYIILVDNNTNTEFPIQLYNSTKHNYFFVSPNGDVWTRGNMLIDVNSKWCFDAKDEFGNMDDGDTCLFVEGGINNEDTIKLQSNGKVTVYWGKNTAVYFTDLNVKKPPVGSGVDPCIPNGLGKCAGRLNLKTEIGQAVLDTPLGILTFGQKHTAGKTDSIAWIDSSAQKLNSGNVYDAELDFKVLQKGKMKSYITMNEKGYNIIEVKRPLQLQNSDKIAAVCNNSRIGAIYYDDIQSVIYTCNNFKWLSSETITLQGDGWLLYPSTIMGFGSSCSDIEVFDDGVSLGLLSIGMDISEGFIDFDDNGCQNTTIYLKWRHD